MFKKWIYLQMFCRLPETKSSSSFSYMEIDFLSFEGSVRSEHDITTHTCQYTQHHLPWQTLQPWSSGNSEKITATIQFPAWGIMEGEVIEWKTLSNARRWCNFAFLLVSFQRGRVIPFLGQTFVSLCSQRWSRKVQCEEPFWTRMMKGMIAPGWRWHSYFWLWIANECAW